MPNGKIVSPEKGSHMYRTLCALNKMNSSPNSIIQKVFLTLSDMDSGIEHNISETNSGSVTRPIEDNGTSITKINYKDVDEVDTEKGDFKDVGITDYELIGHELKHAYDIQFKMNDRGKDKKTGIKISEYETVNFENLIREEEGRQLRTRYTYPIPKELWRRITIWN